MPMREPKVLSRPVLCGTWPSGVRWSTTEGRRLARRGPASPWDTPACLANWEITSPPRTWVTCCAEMGGFGPVEIQDDIMSPRPACWNWATRPPRPVEPPTDVFLELSRARTAATAWGFFCTISARPPACFMKSSSMLMCISYLLSAATRGPPRPDATSDRGGERLFVDPEHREKSLLRDVHRAHPL